MIPLPRYLREAGIELKSAPDSLDSGGGVMVR